MHEVTKRLLQIMPVSARKKKGKEEKRKIGGKRGEMKGKQYTRTVVKSIERM